MSQDNTVSVGGKILRIIAVITGGVLLLGGGLAAYVGVKQLLGELNKPGGPDIETVAQCVVVAITLAIVAGGFFLIRLGFRKPKASSASAESNAAGPVANIPEFGRLIAKCGPQRSGQTHYVVFGAAMMAVAAACYMAPSTFLQPKPGDEKMIHTFSLIATGVSLLFGVGMLWGPLFGRAQEILLYEGGILERLGSSARQITLDQIQHLRLQEFYEHRFAPQTFNVRAKIAGQKDLSFSSSLDGDSDAIITYLAERVGSVETVAFAG